MSYAIVLELLWKFVKTMGVDLWKFFNTPVGKVVLVIGLVYGYGQYQHHEGAKEANAAWSVKWKTHLKADKDENDAANKRIAGLLSAAADINKDLQAQLDAEKAKPPRIIIKEVPKYVTPKADAAAVIPAGFVWVFNESAKADSARSNSIVPDSPPADVDAPSGVALSTVAAVTDYNATECVARGQMLKHWQDWYNLNKAAWAVPPLTKTP